MSRRKKARGRAEERSRKPRRFDWLLILVDCSDIAGICTAWCLVMLVFLDLDPGAEKKEQEGQKAVSVCGQAGGGQGAV